MADEYLDVVIVGAGLSGIGAARYLKTRLPHKTFALWDRRTLLRGRVDDGTLDFSGPKPVVLPPAQRADASLPIAAE